MALPERRRFLSLKDVVVSLEDVLLSLKGFGICFAGSTIFNHPACRWFIDCSADFL
jgi:hypothetical protein